MTQIPMRELSARYPVWFCDIWGVLHNGYQVFAATERALVQHRQQGGNVVLVSNSPRSAQGVADQLLGIGVTPSAWDAIVTSGDVTRELMAHVPGGKLFHLGPSRDLSIFHGLAVERVPLPEAAAVLCTGLFHDEQETPDDYAKLLAEIRALKLPMICANPDKQVRKGNRLLYCAGALAEVYAALGGEVAMAGKPYAPIYDLARHKAKTLRGSAPESDQILAIGDGPETDILGAANQGIDCIYVSGGVHQGAESLEAELAEVQKAVPAACIIMAARELNWD